MPQTRKYRGSWWRMLLLVYPLWAIFALVAYFTDPTVGLSGLLILLILGVPMMSVPWLVSLMYFVSVEEQGFFVKSSSVSARRVAWDSVRSLRPVRLLHFRYVKLVLEGAPKPLWLLLSVQGDAAFREDIIRLAPAGNPLRVYLETGELIERPIPSPASDNTAQASAPTPEEAAEEPQTRETIRNELQLEGSFRSGANWFYWIAGLSVLNMALTLFGSSWSFVVGLAATQAVSAVCEGVTQALPASWGNYVSAVGVLLNICISGVFVLFGIFAGKKLGWAFITGLVFYAMDAALMLLAADYLSAAFHALALFGIFSGYRALKKLKAKG